MGDTDPNMSEDQMIHHLTNSSSPSTLHKLLYSLHDKISSGSDGSADLKWPVFNLGPLERSTEFSSALSNHHLHQSQVLSQALPKQEESGHVTLPMDTIILVCSLFVMVFIGLVFHQIITYLIRARNQRQLYEGGLKTLGENMQIVATNLNPNEQPHHLPLKPIPSIRLSNQWMEEEDDEEDSKKNASILVPDLPLNDNELFKPTTQCMLRNVSNPGNLLTVSQFYHEKQKSAHK